ncbi:regulatory protein RecX [Pontibacter sp. JAM-7]|uniref:regulatory protein RecX n=1 Tax=Pontibacter sp. JAM-7 TaxID=3366581 RepID=UPI003AF5D071
MDRTELRNSILRLLARREYSRYELMQRYSKDTAEDVVESVLDELTESRYLSDARFAESFMRQRLMQYHGWQRISYDLKSKGIGAELRQGVYDTLDVDWKALACDAWAKRFKQPPERQDRKGYARQMRYLMQKGFSHEEANYAIRHACEAEV